MREEDRERKCEREREGEREMERERERDGEGLVREKGRDEWGRGNTLYEEILIHDPQMANALKYGSSVMTSFFVPFKYNFFPRKNYNRFLMSVITKKYYFMRNFELSTLLIKVQHTLSIRN